MVGLVSMVGVTLAGCAAEEEVDPLAVTNSVSITDNTGTGYYTVDGATLNDCPGD